MAPSRRRRRRDPTSSKSSAPDVPGGSEVTALVKKLTHSGDVALITSHAPEVNQLTDMCLQSMELLTLSLRLLTTHLAEKHSEVRLGCLQLMDHLFRRSETFRNSLLEEINEFLILTLGKPGKKDSLPPPRAAAGQLYDRTAECLLEWREHFEQQHPRLKLVYDTAQYLYRVDLDKIKRLRVLEQEAQVAACNRAKARMKEQLEKVTKEMKTKFDEISTLLTSLQTCLELLLPPPEDFFVAGVDDGDGGGPSMAPSGQVDMREFGIIDPKQVVSFTLKTECKVKVTEDNRDVVDSAKDADHQLGKNLPSVKSWCRVLSSVEDPSEEVQGKLQAATRLLEGVERARTQFSSLGLAKQRREDSDSESDLEEVPTKEGYEEQVGDALLAEMIRTRETAREAAQTAAKQNKPPEPEPGPSRVLVKPPAPAEPLPTDIEEWVTKVPQQQAVLSCKPDTHQVWLAVSASASDEVEAPTLSTCPVEFTRTFEPVKWACRAPLPSGRLCPRRDRVKCPLHGKIVPRDETGAYSRPEDLRAEEQRQEEHRRRNPDWQDPKLLEELKKTTGFDLKMPEKGKRKKKEPEFPGLTDLKKKKDTPRSRLAKKLGKNFLPGKTKI